MTNLSSLQQKNQQNFTKHLQKEVVIFDRTHLRILEGNFLDVGEFNLSYFIAQIPLGSLDSTRYMHFGCVNIVEQHSSTRSTRRARLGRPEHVSGAAKFPAHRSAPFTGVPLTAPFPLRRLPAPAPLTLHLIVEPRSPLYCAHLTFLTRSAPQQGRI